jgi:LPXTG-site transpeptidase (sortase) family protein
MAEATGQDPRAARMSRVALGVMGAGVISLLAAVTLFVLTLTGQLGTDGYSGPDTPTAFGSDFLLTPRPTPTIPIPTPSEAPIATIAILKYDITAPVVIRGVDAAGVMQTPDGPTDVAWYDFTSKPGYGSNAVFSGHVDYINYGPAVFWHLKDLVEGDIIEVRLQDGTVYAYRVKSVENVAAATADVGAIVGDTPVEIITLITCGGSWNGHEYDSRTIVRAERAYELTQPGAAVTAQ